MSIYGVIYLQQHLAAYLPVLHPTMSLRSLIQRKCSVNRYLKLTRNRGGPVDLELSFSPRFSFFLILALKTPSNSSTVNSKLGADICLLFPYFVFVEWLSELQKAMVPIYPRTSNNHLGVSTMLAKYHVQFTILVEHRTAKKSA
jgi:hypothetical protein